MRISNPFTGVMPDTGIKSKGSKFWLVAGVVAAAFVGGQVFAGFILGTLVVLGLMFTVERFPGFWSLARNKYGAFVVAMGTGWVAHRIVPGDSITVAVATGWALVLKAVILAFEGVRLRAEKAHKAGEALDRINRFRATQPIQGEWYRSPR